MGGGRQTGAIRIRSLFEIVLIFLFAYVVVQVAPAVVLRMSFLNELEVAANSPVQETAADVRQKVLSAAEGYGITLLSEQLHVRRDREMKKTTIDVTYQLHINFWPNFIYVWNIRERVEGLFL